MAETKIDKLDGLRTVTLNHVNFQDSTDTSTSIKITAQDPPNISISIEETETSVSDGDNTRATARKSSIVSISEIKLTYHKLAVAFVICCIIMLFMLPIIFYYVDGNSNVSDVSSSEVTRIFNVSQVCIHNNITLVLRLIGYLCMHVARSIFFQNFG